MGGIFSEGIDLTEDRLIGALIIGTGLPQVCREREIVKEYFDKKGMDGFAYAYQYPGMNKVLQAAGRVIRTEADRGMILLMDCHDLISAAVPERMGTARLLSGGFAGRTASGILAEILNKLFGCVADRHLVTVSQCKLSGRQCCF